MGLDTTKISVSTYPKGFLFDFEEVRNYCQVERTDQDDVLRSNLRTAIAEVENFTRQTLTSTGFTVYLDNWTSVLNLHKYPVTSIDSVKYYNESGVLTTMSASDYYADIQDYPAKLYFDETYTLRDQLYNNIEVTFTAGWDALYKIPPALVNAVYMLTRTYYDNRNVESKAFNRGQMPIAIKQILLDHRVGTWV